MAEAKKTDTATTSTRDDIRGAWAVVLGGRVLAIESSELKGSRIAIKRKADLLFWPYGADVSDVLRPLAVANARDV